MFLGIDIGTSSVKAVLVDDAGAVAGQASAPLPVSRPYPGWSEQSPADWWTATNRAVIALEVQRRRQVRAIGLSGQMHGATLLDAADRPLRPAILWNDGRSAAQCAALERAVPASRQITGNLAMPGFTAPKLLWVKQHEPDAFAATRCVLLPKDYMRLCMTGAKATDVSDASGTLWLDVAQRAWSDEMLAATGLAQDQMPRLHEGCEITGALRHEVAAAWGMEPVVVAAGGGDNAAGAVGVGVIDEGDALLSLGTSGVLFVAGRAFRPNPARAVHAFCHALPQRWHQMSVMLSAASALDWAARLTGSADARALIAMAQARGRLDGREIFLPYLSGERTPHNDPAARGVLFGLDHESDAAAIGQAVLEGVAFGLADGLDALIEAGAAIKQISMIGGGARSPWWGRVLAAALNRPLTYGVGADVGPAYGAARLARLAVTRELSGEVCAPPPIEAVIEPDASDVAVLTPKRHMFEHLYGDLRGRFGDHLLAATIENKS
ncbi:MAG: xylulokinase [Xanthobacteraceae bacterium]|nr:xylulokinase [Xanthobacteraceae bacterium]